MKVDDLILHRPISIRLLNLLNGLPHETPFQKVIVLDLGHCHDPTVIDTQISGSRIALIIEVSNPTTLQRRQELIAWDWKTGGVVGCFSPLETELDQTPTQVLRYTTDDVGVGDVIPFITVACFLEESWLLALCPHSTPQLLLLNTLLPQRDPRSWRILDLPPRSSAFRYYSILTQYEKPPAELPEFSVDPAQKILVVPSRDKQALVIPVEPLIRRMYSVRANPCIPLDEWVEDTITIYLHPDTRNLELFDTKVLALCGSPLFPQEGWGVRIYDLSKSGQRAQRVSEGAGGGYRRVVSAPKWFARCQMRGDLPHDTRLVGDKVICFYVSPPQVQKSSCHSQRYPAQDWSPSTSRVSSLDIWKLG